jgi:hypothetical protein
LENLAANRIVLSRLTAEIPLCALRLNRSIQRRQKFRDNFIATMKARLTASRAIEQKLTAVDKRLIARDMKAVGLILGQFIMIRREVMLDIEDNRPVTFWHSNCVGTYEPPRFANKSHIARIGKLSGRPQTGNLEKKR